MAIGRLVWIRKACPAGGTTLLRYTWDEAERVYRRTHLEVRNGPSGGSLIELSRAPERLQLEQLEAVVEDATICDDGSLTVYELGVTGQRIWSSLRSARRERLV